METRHAANDEQARSWNGDEAVHWLVHEQRYERMLAPFTGHLLAAAAIGGADRVIDIGCGTGPTTPAAGTVAIQGAALGVDLSVALGQAARRAQQEGLTNVRFNHGNAKVYGFTPGAGDVAVSRFGVTLFTDPAAGFANIAGGLRPGGRLVLVCWQHLADNQWILVPAAAAQQVALPPLDDPTAPGPCSLGERDRIATVVGAAALGDVATKPVAEPLRMGPDLVATVAFLKSTGTWNALLRDADPPTVARVNQAVPAALEPYLTPDGLLLGSRAWLVTASRPWR